MKKKNAQLSIPMFPVLKEEIVPERLSALIKVTQLVRSWKETRTSLLHAQLPGLCVCEREREHAHARVCGKETEKIEIRAP